jgi:hypothetical protein
MPQTYSKALLSGSTNGKQITVFGTGTSSSKLIHTATASAGTLDEIWIYASAQGTATNLTLCWGGTVYPDDYVTSAVPVQAGKVLVTDGKLLQGGLTVTAFTTVGTLMIDGFVNRIY